MWNCQLCQQQFKFANQKHSCKAADVAEFLRNKSPISIQLFEHLIKTLALIGPVKLHTTKSMIVISSSQGFAYVTTMGKNFVEVVLPFKETFDNNLCFRKIASVPNSNDYNHHLRIMLPEDLNEEVIEYLRKAYAKGKNI